MPSSKGQANHSEHRQGIPLQDTGSGPEGGSQASCKHKKSCQRLTTSEGMPRCQRIAAAGALGTLLKALIMSREMPPLGHGTLITKCFLDFCLQEVADVPYTTTRDAACDSLWQPTGPLLQRLFGNDASPEAIHTSKHGDRPAVGHGGGHIYFCQGVYPGLSKVRWKACATTHLEQPSKVVELLAFEAAQFCCTPTIVPSCLGNIKAGDSLFPGGQLVQFQIQLCSTWRWVR